jgi:hypothetical protein
MNYAKLLSAATTLFPKTVKVKLIDAATGELLHKHKIPLQQLPVAFNKPTILEINNLHWRVLKADPVLADDFMFTKKLTLHVRDAATMSAHAQELFDVPSICDPLPATGASVLYNEFTLAITGNGWRQLEFLPIQHWSIIEEEIKTVEGILGGQPNALIGYVEQYHRKKTGAIELGIPWQTFFALLPRPMSGNVYYDEKGFVENGFALRTESYTYYGLLKNGNIQSLCLTQYDGIDDELMQVLETFKLVLTDWCNASTLSAEPGETPKSEFVNF